MSQRRIPSYTRLAHAIAALLALSAPLAHAAATTWIVDSCAETSNNNGNHHGSLRYVASAAASGDTLDMTALPCSKITLQTGAIHLAQSALTIQAAGPGKMLITGASGNVGSGDRIFNHTGTGNLQLSGMSISNGVTYDAYSADGGCIKSAGNLTLSNVAVSYCSAVSPHLAHGGAVFTAGALSLKYSNIRSSSATSSYSAQDAYNPGGFLGHSYGGGAFVSGNLLSLTSSVAYNHADYTSRGGGVLVRGNASIGASAIYGNYAMRSGGLEASNTAPAGHSLRITNSTISYNGGIDVVGGIYSNFAAVTLASSTISHNFGRIHPSASPTAYLAAGVAIGVKNSMVTVDLESSIIANNTYNDFSAAYTSASHAITVTGANNIVRASAGVTVSAAIASTACPLLGPLRNNGGPTLTRALASGSPAIDHGNNSAGQLEDQRGLFADSPPYAYARTSGVDTDMGAFEVQQAESIFNSSFEGCP